MRALVLGGGGVTGIAWEIGMLRGLERAGLVLREADLVVGTSAGSAVAAQLGGTRTLDDLYESQLTGAASELVARITPLTLLRFVLAGLDPDRTRGLKRLGRQARTARLTATPEERKGGFPFAANVQLAAGADTVVVLAPVTAGIAARASVAAQVRALPATTKVIVVSPDREARSGMGRYSLDPSARRAAAEAGMQQAGRHPEQSLAVMRAIWR